MIRGAGQRGITQRDLSRKTQWLSGRERNSIMASLIESEQITIEQRPTRSRPANVYRATKRGRRSIRVSV